MKYLIVIGVFYWSVDVLFLGEFMLFFEDILGCLCQMVVCFFVKGVMYVVMCNCVEFVLDGVFQGDLMYL